MGDREFEELQEPGNWDFQRAEKRPGVRKPRAVVSVAFSREDFERVSQYAENVGTKTSEFIREAALARVASQGARGTIVLASGGFQSIIYAQELPAVTTVSGGITFLEQNQDLVTV